MTSDQLLSLSIHPIPKHNTETQQPVSNTVHEIALLQNVPTKFYTAVIQMLTEVFPICVR